MPPDWQGIGALDDAARAEFRKAARAALAERGWAAPAWPVEYGGAGLSAAELVVLTGELSAAGIPFGSNNDAFGIGILGNTIRPRLVSWTERFAAAAAATGTFPRLRFAAEGLHDRFRFLWPTEVIPAYPALAGPRTTLARVPGWREPGV